MAACSSTMSLPLCETFLSMSWKSTEIPLSISLHSLVSRACLQLGDHFLNNVTGNGEGLYWIGARDVDADDLAGPINDGAATVVMGSSTIVNEDIGKAIAPQIPAGIFPRRRQRGGTCNQRKINVLGIAIAGHGQLDPLP